MGRDIVRSGIFAKASSGGSGSGTLVAPIDMTVAVAQAAILASSLTYGQTYRITDAASNTWQIILIAVSTNELARDGIGIYIATGLDCAVGYEITSVTEEMLYVHDTKYENHIEGHAIITNFFQWDNAAWAQNQIHATTVVTVNAGSIANFTQNTLENGAQLTINGDITIFQGNNLHENCTFTSPSSALSSFTFNTIENNSGLDMAGCAGAVTSASYNQISNNSTVTITIPDPLTNFSNNIILGSNVDIAATASYAEITNNNFENAIITISGRGGDHLSGNVVTSGNFLTPSTLTIDMYDGYITGNHVTNGSTLSITAAGTSASNVYYNRIQDHSTLTCNYATSPQNHDIYYNIITGNSTLTDTSSVLQDHLSSNTIDDQSNITLEDAIIFQGNKCSGMTATINAAYNPRNPQSFLNCTYRKYEYSNFDLNLDIDDITVWNAGTLTYPVNAEDFVGRFYLIGMGANITLTAEVNNAFKTPWTLYGDQSSGGWTVALGHLTVAVTEPPYTAIIGGLPQSFCTFDWFTDSTATTTQIIREFINF